MAAGASAYLVVRRDDGFGDVFTLQAGARYTLGRAATSRIVLKDELCSREHAEVYFAEGRWRLRDLSSLNGTRLNGATLDSEWELSPKDEIHLGRTRLVFVELMEQLPELPMRPHAGHKWWYRCLTSAGIVPAGTSDAAIRVTMSATGASTETTIAPSSGIGGSSAANWLSSRVAGMKWPRRAASRSAIDSRDPAR